ncbi:MAG: hypothetical protein MUP85_01460 [Candidatus Lokiarchaeota archaeon]|nr:hypothetical protein [Candidatus Lokiarchaeota archaeon]
MEQTQKQLEITQENVRFNNYYKHKEEFKILLKENEFFELITKKTGFKIEDFDAAIYSQFFNSSYKNFEPKLNESAKAEIFNFIDQIKNSEISNDKQDLNEVPIEEMKKLYKLINSTLDPIFTLNNEIEIVSVLNYFTGRGKRDKQLIEERFNFLSSLFWCTSFYERFLAFDGIVQSKRANFVLNFNDYRKSVGLT